MSESLTIASARQRALIARDAICPRPWNGAAGRLIVRLRVAAGMLATAIIALAMLGAAPAVAQDQAPGQWRVAKVQGAWTAYTTNGSGSVLGVSCASTCRYYMNDGMICNVGGLYGVMVAAPDPRDLHLSCEHVANTALLFFRDDIGWRLAGDFVAFAMPVGDARFSVFRFSLAGAKEAVAMAAMRSKQGGASASSPKPGDGLPYGKPIPPKCNWNGKWPVPKEDCIIN